MMSTNRSEWHPKMSKVFFSFLLTIVPVLAHAFDYYVSLIDGSDVNDGLTQSTPFQSLARVNSLNLLPGDRLLFKSGEQWQGMLWPKGSGSLNALITITAYGNGARPIIDGDGYQASILLFNDDHYEISGLELTNEASHLASNGTTKKLSGFGGCNVNYSTASNSYGSGRDARFGIKVVASERSLSQFSFNDLDIHDIFPSPNSPDSEGVNCTRQGYGTTLKNQGYGIKFESQSDANANNFYTISDIVIDDITVSRTGHYGVWIKPLGVSGIELYKHDNITLRNSSFLNTGGAGFVPTRASNVLVENNVFDGAGSSLDPRMYGRGSGTWPFASDNVLIQNNVLMNAKGPLDSYGVHIDYNNTNVLVQYNLSYNNEGGFAQILGANVNSGYRYNISVADGSRVEGVNGAVQNGRIFNVSRFCNINAGCVSIGNFIYNNTVYIPDTMSPEIYFQAGSGETKFYNNLIYAEERLESISAVTQIQGVDYDISNNLFYPSSAFSLTQELSNNALFFNPRLRNAGSISASMYKLLPGSDAKYAGSIINASINSSDYSNNNGGFDYFGNAVSDSTAPHIGAYNSNELLAEYIGAGEVEIPTLSNLMLVLLSMLTIAISIINKKAINLE